MNTETILKTILATILTFAPVKAKATKTDSYKRDVTSIVVDSVSENIVLALSRASVEGKDATEDLKHVINNMEERMIRADAIVAPLMECAQFSTRAMEDAEAIWQDALGYNGSDPLHRLWDMMNGDSISIAADVSYARNLIRYLAETSEKWIPLVLRHLNSN